MLHPAQSPGRALHACKRGQHAQRLRTSWTTSGVSSSCEAPSLAGAFSSFCPQLCQPESLFLGTRRPHGAHPALS